MSLAMTIHESLTALASQKSPSHTALDVYRVIHDQAKLLLQTECAREHLAQDPFQALAAVDTDDLSRRIRVVDYECVRTRQDYVRIYAVVELQDPRRSSTRRPSPVVVMAPRLVFLFEREAGDDGGTAVTYSIDFAPDPCRAMMKLLYVQVLALGSHPSQKPARDMNPTRHEAGVEEGDDDADWSDVDSETEEKEGRASHASDQDKEGAENLQDETADNDCDRFVADMDPDVLDEFINLVGKMDQATAFFLLMSFPFYEMEWDIVGFVLDSVFGAECDDDFEKNEVDEPSRTNTQPKKKSKRQ